MYGKGELDWPELDEVSAERYRKVEKFLQNRAEEEARKIKAEELKRKRLEAGKHACRYAFGTWSRIVEPLLIEIGRRWWGYQPELRRQKDIAEPTAEWVVEVRKNDYCYYFKVKMEFTEVNESQFEFSHFVILSAYEPIRCQLSEADLRKKLPKAYQYGPAHYKLSSDLPLTTWDIK